MFNFGCEHSGCEVTNIRKLDSMTEIGNWKCWRCYVSCTVKRTSVLCLSTQWKLYTVPVCSHKNVTIGDIEAYDDTTEITPNSKCQDCNEVLRLYRKKTLFITPSWKLTNSCNCSHSKYYAMIPGLSYGDHSITTYKCKFCGAYSTQPF